MNTSTPNVTAQMLVCPRCGEKGKPVKPLTLQSLLKPAALARTGSGAYRFCPGERCEVVYFSEADGVVFTKPDVTVRVGIKETAAPRPVCYCFNHTIEEIEEEVRRTGRTTVLDDIKTRMKQACWCETKSPLGSCCLATVTKYVNQALARPGSGAAHAELAVKQEDCCAGHGDAAAGATGNMSAKAPANANKPAGTRPRVSTAEKFAWIGSVFSALVASACCWLPLVLLAFGVSGVAVSATFEKYRPIFIGVTFAFLAVAFYFAYRPRTKAAASGGAESQAACCAVPPSADDCCAPAAGRKWTLQKFNRVMLWVVTAVALAFIFFPSYVGALFGSRQDAGFGADLDRVVVSVEGMTCKGCATTLENELKSLPAVRAAKVSYEKKEALLGIPRETPAPRGEILKVIAAAGFKGQFQNLAEEAQPSAHK